MADSMLWAMMKIQVVTLGISTADPGYRDRDVHELYLQPPRILSIAEESSIIRILEF